MKKILFLALLIMPLAISAQNFVWSGSITKKVAADTIIWAYKFRPNAPWSLDIKYDAFNGTTATFAIIVSNWTDGSWNYYPTNVVTFPVTLNPTADQYTGQFGGNKSTRPYYGPYIIFMKFGIRLTWGNTTTGAFQWRLKQ